MHITFEEFMIEGFGKYREPTAFTFAHGVNRYVAENETGKTTMVAGIVATIFGLSHRQRNVSAFHLERFRNWENPATCRGELILTVQEKRYRIRRNFDTHHVALSQANEDTGQYEILVDGQHNPEARKPLKLYEDYLQQILGISSQELFQDTFFVAQPLPEKDQISGELQSLLAGSKGTSFDEALMRLQSNLKNLTKYTGPNDRGITTRNMNKDGEIEKLTEDLQKFENVIDSGKQVADSLIEVQQQVEKVESELKEKRQQLEQKISTQQAWSSWQLMANQYASAAKERSNLISAFNQVEDLTKKINVVENALKNQYPAFEGVCVEVEEDLGEIIYIQEQIEKCQTNIQKMAESYDNALKQNASQAERLEQYAGWKTLGDDPVEKIKAVRRSAANCIKNWEGFQENWEALQKVKKKLSQQYDPFEKITKEQQEVIKNWNASQSSCAIEKEKAQQVYNAAVKSIQDFEDAQENHHKKHTDLMVLPSHAATAATCKCKLLKEKRVLEKCCQEKGQQKTTPIGIRLVGGVIPCGIAFALLGTQNVPMLIMGLVLAVIVGALGMGFIYPKINTANKKEQLAKQQELGAVNKQIAACDQQLGAFATADDLELVRLTERIKQYEEEKRRLQSMREYVASIDIKRFKQRLERVVEAENILQLKAKRITDAYTDVQASYDEWDNLSKEKQRLETDTNKFAQATFGCSSDNFSEVEVISDDVDEQWREIAVCLNILTTSDTQQNIKTVGSLIKKIVSLSDSWWKEREQDAATLLSYKKEMQALYHQLEPMKQRLDEEKEQKAQLIKKQHALRQPLQDILSANENDAKKALAQYKKRKEQVRDQENITMKLETIFKNNEVSDAQALKIKSDRLQDQVAGRMLKWEEHIERYPGLPTPEQADDIEKVQQKMQTLTSSIEIMKDEIEKLEMQRSEFYRQLARLEGESPINIAAAELELKDLKEQKAQSVLRADALTLAYKELEAAITKYRKTYKKRLEDSATAYCQQVCDVTDRKIVLNDQLSVGIVENGRPITTDYLSKGARDQVYLSLRFAVADLLSEDIKLPLIFDDPFTSTDAKRLERIRIMMEKQSAQRQFFLLAHADSYKEWGEPIGIK